MKTLLRILSFLGILIILNIPLFKKNLPPTPPHPPSVKGTTIWAQVGENYLYLSGYTSPLASVFLSSSVGNLKRQTIANQNGFFVFQFVFLPQETGELCLIAQDINGLVSPPLYLPEPPQNQDVFIENILLPPTLLLSEGIIKYQSQAVASGRTFPNSKVLVYQYLNPSFSLKELIKEKIIKPVFAKTAPILEVESNQEGYFEFNLPTYLPAEQRIFVASLFLNQDYSPKSFTLTFKTLSSWEKICLFLLSAYFKIYLWFKSLGEEPTKIIWLEIPLLVILFAKVLWRGWVEKISNE